MKTLTAKQINKQLQTWKRNAPDTYKSIMTRARQEGALTPSGNITSKKEGAFFRSWYTEYKGSYKSKVEEVMGKEGVEKETAIKIIELSTKKTDIINHLFETYSSDQAYQIMKLSEDTEKKYPTKKEQLEAFLSEVEKYDTGEKEVDIVEFNRIMENERGKVVFE